MNRIEAINALAKTVKAQLTTAQKAYDASHASVTSEESKQEGKYDTRGLEESYLANGLVKKIADFEAIISFLQTCEGATPSEAIESGSLIKGRQGNAVGYYFLSIKGGGIDAMVGDDEVMMITGESPIGTQLLGKKAGESTTAPQVYIQEVL